MNGRARLRSQQGGREFIWLLAGQTVSDAGSQATTVVLPLLALVLTGSPLQAGLVSVARGLSYPLASLPAGVLSDRYDRRRLLLVSSTGRSLIMAAVVVTLALGHPPLLELLLVAFADSALYTLGATVERGALRQLLPVSELPRALAMGEGRTATAAIAGPPLGGALFAAGRALPFVFDALSSVAAVTATLGIRTPLQEGPMVRATGGLAGAARHAVEGLRWLWQRPFLRASSLLYAALNLSGNALELLVLLIAHRYGASSTAVGVMFALVGAGALVGALVAERSGHRLPPRLSIALEPCLFLLLTPLLLLVHNAVAIGFLGGAMFLWVPLSTAAVISRRVALTPDRLQGRVQAGASLMSTSIAWVGPLAIGAVFGRFGAAAATLTLVGWELIIVLGLAGSASLRSPSALSAEPA